MVLEMGTPMRIRWPPLPHPRPGFASGSIGGGPIYANFGTSWRSSDPSNHAGSELDGFYITIPGKGCTA